MINSIEIDKLTPCLERLKGNEIVNTSYKNIYSCNTFLYFSYYIPYKGNNKRKTYFFKERGSRLCQKIEDAVDSDLVMIVAVL